MNQPQLERIEPLARVIAQRLAVKPEHFITHPSEMKLFRALSDEELRDFAHQHGWRVVRRLGGRRVEFYNDAHEHQERARTGNVQPSGEAAVR
ncbi:MAG TPA: hypothetical protein VGI85_15710 [Chthoniobacterales bacterium]|jgi:hypothetical protein